MSETDDPRQKLAKKIAINRRERREKDPHGFWDMGERELVEWMGAGNAVPGSITYEQARLVLEHRSAMKPTSGHSSLNACRSTRTG